MTDIDPSGGYVALAINDANMVVGFASHESIGVAHAFVYADHIMKEIVK